MTFAKIRRYRAFTATIIACFVASSASAAMLATNDFETSFADFTTDDTLATLASYNGDGPSDAASYPFGSFGSKYMSVDTDDATLWRSFAPRSADVYFDSYVKLTPMCDDFEYANDAKFVIYLDSATSNLCVISGAAANDRTAVTNSLVSAPIAPNTWGRLTINAISSGGVFAFQVKLNGTLLATSGSVDTFYSLTADTTLSEFGISGTGALDNFAVRTTDPLFSGTVAATIGGADGEKYASLEDALAEADADTVVSLAADHAGKVYLADAATYKIDPGSYSFGGVVGANGYKVTASEPVAGVTTYTATDAFASQPSPVVLWDGASVNYDFNTLTRTVGGTTYTMVVNDANAAINSAKDYITIGSENQKWTVKITADAAGALGSTANSGFTVIAKVANAGTTESANRAILNYYTSTYQAAVSFAQAQNGKAFPMINESAWSASATDANTLSSDAIQSVALTYDTLDGVRLFVDGSQKWSNGTSTGFTGAPEGITIGGVPIDNSNKLYALKGMKIYAVALFDTKLTNEQIAAFTFPSSRIAEDIAVSEINSIFGSAGEIWLDVADGVTITGDTTFNASTVHFICDGSFTMTAPAGNTAVFDFSGVTGKPVIEYISMPTVSGSVFTSTTVPEFVTDSTKWSGVIYISSGTFTDFTSNAFGNDSSLVRLGNVSGWLRAPGNYAFTNTVPVELVGTLSINNGNSANDGNPNRCSVFKKLSGNGGISANSTADKVVVVIQDASEFTGGIGLNGGKVIVFGETMPAYERLEKATIFVMEGTSVTANGFWWATGGKIFVDGELRAPNLDKFGGGTYITTSDTGTFVLVTNSDTDDLDVDYKRITGTGTLRYEGEHYRTISRNNFPTNMIVENNLANSGLIHRVPNTELTIGSLAGNGRMRSDWGGSGSTGDRDLRILQSKETTYSGLFDAVNDRIRMVYVAPGVSSAGTLTLSGTQTASNGLTVESGAKVNLTGTWVGDATVAGTFGGTGTLTGNLTLADGATLKASAPSVSVSGNLTATGAIALELPAGALDGGSCTLLAVGGTADLSGATFTATVGGEPVDLSRHEVKLVNGQLVLQLVLVKRGTGLLLF